MPLMRGTLCFRMKTENLPVLMVSDVEPDSRLIKGQVSRWQWVGEGWIAYLYLGGGQLIEGRFRNVDETTKGVSFAVEASEFPSGIAARDSIPFFDGYWGERAVIVLNEALQWRKETFKTGDAIRYYMVRDGDTLRPYLGDGQPEIEAGGNTHNHCDICWATISESENHQYMRSSNDDGICVDCFRKYVGQRSIGFVEQA